MNIVHLHPGPDTGGQSMAGKRYLEEAGHDVRVFTTSPHKFRYPMGEMWDTDLVSAAVERADVVVMHNDARVLKDVGGWQGKRLILHHHGSHFRGNPAEVYERGVKVGARHVVSTIDLLLSVPDGGTAEWFPQVVDVDRMRAIRDARADVWKPRVRPLATHAPTNRGIKGTRHVERAQRLLRKEVDILVISHKTWDECLRLKASSDVFIDQLRLGYGANAIEAWAMGLPVISGAEPAIIEEMRRHYPLPFYLTTPELLIDDVRMMATEPVVREAWIEAGRVHLERFHAPEAWTRNALSVFGFEEAVAA